MSPETLTRPLGGVGEAPAPRRSRANRRFLGLVVALGALVLLNVVMTPNFLAVQTLAVNVSQVATVAIVGIAEALQNPKLTGGVVAMFEGILEGIRGFAPAFDLLAAKFGEIAGLVGVFAAEFGPLLADSLAAFAPVISAIVAGLSALVPILMILFGLGDATIVATVFLFAVWIIALDTQAGVKHISGSLVEMSRSFGASQRDVYLKILLWAALPEILAGIRLGMIRGVKGVVIGQLLVSVIGYGELFELYSRNFLMERFWALTILVFAFAILVSELVGAIEKRVEYYAGVRQ